VLTLLGAPNVAVYDGSLAEWTADPSLPMESDLTPRPQEPGETLTPQPHRGAQKHLFEVIRQHGAAPVAGEAR
jgi:hypothetical protein